MNASPAMGYRLDIDGLRAIAVIAVIVNHINEAWLPSGHLGVDMFFVISGFVITRSLLGREPGPIGPFLLSFYARRVKRLLPALGLCVVLTGIATALFIPDPRQFLITGVAALFGVANIYLDHTGSDYFAASTRLNPFTHMWSLGVEEQFYLLFPLLFWLLAGPGTGARGGPGRGWAQSWPSFPRCL